MTNSDCYSTVDLVRDTTADEALALPGISGRADSELAFATLLGLHPGTGAAPVNPLRHVVLGLMLALALGLALVGLGGML
jgi:hypothetical protein